MDCFYFLALTNSGTMNTFIPEAPVKGFSRVETRKGICIIVGDANVCLDLHSNHHCMRVPASLPLPHLLRYSDNCANSVGV